MEWTQALLLIAVGAIAGFFNTVAGGGSLLTLPTLIFMGLPASVANATNRVAILVQNISGVAGFKSKGVFVFPYSLYLGLSAILGSIVGAKISVELNDEIFNKIIAVVMVLVVAQTLFLNVKTQDKANEIYDVKSRFWGIISFFFVGIYGGFIQAGVGFIIIGTLTAIHRFSLVKTNSIKVFVVLIYTIAALIVFIIEGEINWLYGIVLSIGNASGAWIASRWSVKKGDKTLRYILAGAVAILAINLWFF